MQSVKPISFLKSSFYFAIPGFILFVGVYYFVPFLHSLGMPLLLAFLLFLWGSTIPLLPLSIYLYYREGNKMDLISFKQRFRLTNPNKKNWVLIIIVFVIAFLCDALLGETGKWLGKFSIFSPPDYLAAPFNPFKEIFPFTHLFDLELKGKWWILVVWIPLHLLSMIGEEFMWRGYILPRQEVAYGKMCWVINGLQWAYIVHFFMKWNFIAFLPSMLLVAWLAYKTKSTYASLFVHAVSNSFLWILIGLGIAGAW